MEDLQYKLRLVTPESWVGKPQPTFVFEGLTVEQMEQLTKVVNAMGQKMIALDGLSLAAPQVGLEGRVFVMRGYPDLMVCFNPKIVSVSDEKIMLPEQCPSYPGLVMNVHRPVSCRVRYQTLTGEVVTEKMTGLTARAFFQMTDTLNGIAFHSHCSKFVRDRALVKWNKLRKQFSQFNLKPKGSL